MKTFSIIIIPVYHSDHDYKISLREVTFFIPFASIKISL